MTPAHERSLRPISENSLIRLLHDRYQVKHRWIRRGIGDDAAVVHPRGAHEYWLITSDMLLENIDFCRESIEPASLGYKALAVNLSDLAAMGARPRFYTVSLALPSEISQGWILRFYKGMSELGRSYGAYLIGGDLSGSKSGISVSITALGESLKRRVVYRTGGRAGDWLYVTGTLGKSAAGLKLVERGLSRPQSRVQKAAIWAHQRPEPRCKAGLWLAQSGLIHCMMDLSDGLSTDLARLCAASKVGAEVYASWLPVFAESAAWGCDPVQMALHGGEDFELLFAVPESKAELLEKSYPSTLPAITRIGRLTGERGIVRLRGRGKRVIRLKDQGYDHFRLRKDFGAPDKA